jgi:hypothetical protein
VSNGSAALAGTSTFVSSAKIAHVEVPGGTYDVCAWKIGYNLLLSTVHVAGETTVHLEVAMTPEPEQPYWM